MQTVIPGNARPIAPGFIFSDGKFTIKGPLASVIPHYTENGTPNFPMAKKIIQGFKVHQHLIYVVKRKDHSFSEYPPVIKASEMLSAHYTKSSPLIHRLIDTS